MQIHQASLLDKKMILDFCQNTFSWGDYIAEVWEYWISEGNLLAAYVDEKPVAICHASINLDAQQVWIEGIRVNPEFRQKGVATKLVKNAENIAFDNNCKTSYMLIETNNHNSISLSKKLHYEKIETWSFFTLSSKNNTSSVHFPDLDQKIPKLLYSSNLTYVQSWRWYPLTNSKILSLVKDNRIIFSIYDDEIGLAIFTDSEHFDGTLLVTLLSISENTIQSILGYIQNFAHQNNYKRIQILTKLTDLPTYDNLEKKLSFNLMQKTLH